VRPILHLGALTGVCSSQPYSLDILVLVMVLSWSKIYIGDHANVLNITYLQIEIV
jgi:hypothetical protein